MRRSLPCCLFELLFFCAVLWKLDCYARRTSVVFVLLVWQGGGRWSQPCCCCCCCCRCCSTAWISKSAEHGASCALSFSRFFRQMQSCGAHLPGSCCASVVCPQITQEQHVEDVLLTLSREKFGSCTAVAFAMIDAVHRQQKTSCCLARQATYMYYMSMLVACWYKLTRDACM